MENILNTIEMLNKNMEIMRNDFAEVIIKCFKGIFNVKGELKFIKGYENYLIATTGDVFNVKNMSQVKTYKDKRGYTMVVLNGNHWFRAHKLVANAFLDNPENKKCVDHIDGNIENNNICNLRLATACENAANRIKHKKGSSIYKGVSKVQVKHTKWWARISCKGKYYDLGYYNTEREAALAYNNKAQELFGEFANLNKV